MIKGMTGFGFVQVSVAKTKAIVEIKSVNHRYLDINFYLPTGFGAVEDKIRQLIQKSVQRGRITVAVKFLQRPEQIFSFNKEAIRQYLRQEKATKKEFPLSGQLSFSDLVALPGVVEVRESLLDPSSVFPSIEKGIRAVLKSMDQMRKREGRSLSADLRGNLKKMRQHTKKIEVRARDIFREKKKILSTEEFLSFQKGTDINEELARLTHHVDEFKGLLKTSDSVGKKLDFIAQEMQRETNTIGSKLQDAVVSDAVISLKSKIEKIREQAQNIE